jgi:abortive infection bacteriophage resistance protein
MQSRGLVVPDSKRAERHIATVGYYRLMGYGKHFFDSTIQRFNAGTTYDHIWETYKFDRKLRLLTLDAIERIEVAMRTAMSNTMCMAHGSHWFMNPLVFKLSSGMDSFCSALRKELPIKQNEITKHYYSKYDAPDLPPSWMVMECISMGTWVKALGNMKQTEQKRIADAMKMNPKSFVSWASSLTWARNVCAHHGVLWNRTNMRPPKTPLPAMRYPSIEGKESSYFAVAVIAYGLLKLIVTRSTWANRLEALFADFPLVNPADMGFEPNWKKDIFWT